MSGVPPSGGGLDQTFFFLRFFLRFRRFWGLKNSTLFSRAEKFDAFFDAFLHQDKVISISMTSPTRGSARYFWTQMSHFLKRFPVSIAQNTPFFSACGGLKSDPSKSDNRSRGSSRLMIFFKKNNIFSGTAGRTVTHFKPINLKY